MVDGAGSQDTAVVEKYLLHQLRLCKIIGLWKRMQVEKSRTDGEGITYRAGMNGFLQDRSKTVKCRVGSYGAGRRGSLYQKHT